MGESNREFDVIVIGAGNGGLASAAQLAHYGINVLCLEKHNIPGGFASSFVRGRFEFEASLHVIAEIGTPERPANLRKFLDDMGVKIDWIRAPELYRLISKQEDIDFIIPFGIDNVINAIESQYPGSKEYVKRYLSLCEEVFNAVMYLQDSSDSVDKLFLMKNFPNFIRTATYSVDQVLDRLKIPLKIRYLFHGFWAYLGIPTTTLNWGVWAIVVYSMLNDGAYVPKFRSTRLSLALAKKIRDSGGLLECNSEVKRIATVNQKVSGVVTNHGEFIKCKQILSNASPNLVYNHLMPINQVPPIAFQNINSRLSTLAGFVVYLGLDKSAEDLGIDTYSYITSNTFDTTKMYNAFNSGSPELSASMCLNKVFPNSSPEGTCMVTITALTNPQHWKGLDVESYHPRKRQHAAKIIKDFEKHTKIPISQHIEEIEIATPITFSHYFNSYNGVIYAYDLQTWDHTLSRMMMLEDEEYIKGLNFVGSHVNNQGFSSSLISGILRAQDVYKKINQGSL